MAAEGGAPIPYLGSKISLISKSDIRYEGILYTVDPNDSTVALQNVRSFGTENRRPQNPVPPSNEVYEYIIFRGSDINDIHIATPPVSTLPTTPAVPAMPVAAPQQAPTDPNQPTPNQPGFPTSGYPGYYPGYPGYSPYGLPYGYPGYGYPSQQVPGMNPFAFAMPGQPSEPAPRIPEQKSVGGKTSASPVSPSKPQTPTAAPSGASAAPVSTSTPAPNPAPAPVVPTVTPTPAKAAPTKTAPAKTAPPKTWNKPATATQSAPTPAPVAAPAPVSKPSGSEGGYPSRQDNRRQGGASRENPKGPGRSQHRREPAPSRPTPKPDVANKAEDSQSKSRTRRPQEQAPMVMPAGDFDFTTATLDKEKLRTEVEADTKAETKQEADDIPAAYNPKRSFFDNLSTSVKEKGDPDREKLAVQRQTDMDTFGLSKPYRRNNNRNHNSRNNNRGPRRDQNPNDRVKRTHTLQQPSGH